MRSLLRRLPKQLASESLRRRRLRLEKLCSRDLLAADLVISEFLASNGGGIEDEDGDSSDWVEIHNPTDAAVDLSGWTLTDDVDLSAAQRWTFPEITIAPQDYVVVFASGKDRAVAGDTLHTDFKLAGDGEFLGLISPDETVVSAFAPAYPAQVGDVSYGLPFRNESKVVANGTVQYLVPSDASNGDAWQQPGFDAATWNDGPGGIGYGVVSPGFDVTYTKARSSGAFNGVVNSVAVARDVLANPDYQQTVLTERVETVNYLGSGAGANFGGDLAFPGQTIGDDINHFIVEALSTITIPAPGDYTFGVNSDDGFQLSLTGPGGTFGSEFLGTRGPNNTLATFSIPVAGSYDLDLLFFEAGGGAALELFAAPGTHSTFDAGVFDLVGDVAAGGLAAVVPYIAGENELVGTDIATVMDGVSGTVYSRMPFQVDDVTGIDSVLLDIHFDDGFVAYLNGVLVAQANAPMSPSFNAVATATRDAADVAQSSRFVLTGSALSALQVGENVLAIHGLNSTSSDGSFLISASLRLVGINETAPAFFATPTPNNPNGESFVGFVESVSASVGAGFYSTPQTVTLVTPTAGATIRYTTDGSAPTATHGVDYTGPITISSTTNLRATAIRDEYLPANSRTWSYLFLDDVLTQSTDGSPPAGFPAEWNTNVVDYGVDPDVIATEGAEVVKDALLSIPSWSITTDVDNLFGSENGIYSNALQDGRDWERPASIELIQPDGSDGFQINAGVRIRGGYSRGDFNAKHSFRLFFRNEYGDGSLVYPVHGPDGTDTFDKIDLRTPQNYSWSSNGNPSNQFIAEYIARKNQREMGQPSTRSSWLHLYLNGQYWGMYQTQERAEANFAETYLGGDKDNYDVLKPERGPYENYATDGDSEAYSRLFDQSVARAADGITPAFVDDANYYRAQGLNPDGTKNPEYETLLDVENLIVYMIEIFRGGNFDAPISKFLGNRRINNYFAIRDRTGDEGFKFFIHDSEHSLRNLDGVNRLQVNRVGPFNDPNFESGVGFFNPQWLHQQLMANEEYRVAFGDKVQEVFFGDGPLSNANQIASWQEEADVIDLAVIGESLRWGDSRNNRADNPLLQSDFRNAIADIRDNYLPFRNDILMDQFRNATLQLADGSGGYTTTVSAPLFPTLAAPTLAIDNTPQDGGVIEPNANLSLLAPDTVYFTTDGTDPRLAGGAIAPGAIPYDPTVATDTVFGFGSQWRYDDTGTDLGTDWRSETFDDASWSTGIGEFGYGDGDEATTIANTTNNQLPTTYFRKEFTLGSDPFDSASLQVIRDDGVVVYINGVEVARNNLPVGAVTYGTFANSAIGNAAESQPLTFAIPPSVLNPGQNTIAVEIHQVSATSSDVSFDAALTLTQTTNIPLPDSTTVNARTRTSDGNWSALTQADFIVPRTAADANNLRITEIHYNPLIDGDAEFIEIQNVSSGQSAAIISLDGVTLTEGPNAPLTLPATATLAPGDFALMVKDIAAFTAAYPLVDTSLIVGEYSGSLRNSGEQIELVDAAGLTIADIDYLDDDPWSEWADGNGGSLVPVESVQQNADGSTRTQVIDKSYAWRGSTLVGGSPGTADPPRAGVVINEILSHTDLPQVDSIELLNPTNTDINIGGWFLSDDEAALTKFVIPANTILGPGEFIVFDESDFNPTPLTPAPNHFGLSASQGERVWLTLPDASGTLVSAISDMVSFDATYNGISVGRTPEVSSRLVPLDSVTLGSANSGHRLFDVLITEVNYHPEPPNAAAIAIAPLIVEDDLEFIEITNRSETAVDLSGYEIAGQSTYVFEPVETLSVDESILVIGFDPDAPVNADRVSAFRAHYTLDPTVRLVGPLSAKLSNSESLLRLLAPDDPPLDNPTINPRVLVDEILYDDLAPWPVDADGTGASLQRVSSDSLGTMPDSWAASTPTPGVTRYIPRVESVVINGGDNSRSAITSIEIEISDSIETPDSSAFEITETNSATVVGNVQAQMQLVDGRSVITLTFGADPMVDVRQFGLNSLVDGTYEIRIRGDQLVAVTGGAADTGDSYFGDDAADAFYRQYGDTDGNGSVNLSDFATFRSQFGTAFGDPSFNDSLDADGNGIVDLLDFGRFRAAFGSTGG